MQNVYSIEMKLCATIYVKAKSEAEALEAAKGFSEGCFEFSGDGVSDLQYNDPELPEISLSPAMTGHGFWDDNPEQTIDLVEEGVR